MRRRIRQGGWGGRLALVGALALVACGPKQTPISQLPPEELWVRGTAEFNERDWDEAIRYLERFVIAAGADPRVYQARYYIGQARFEREEYVLAATEFARLAGDLGRAELADDARFMACRAYEELSPPPPLDQEYTRGAIEHCRALIEYFPDSEYVDRAGEIVDRMRARLAEKVYGNGEWYRRRRAYDSSLVYYQDVAEQYPGTIWAPRALKRMVEVYETLGYVEERDAARERLLRDYPDSAEAREVAAGS